MDRAFRDDDAIMRALMATQCGTSWIMGCTGPVGAVSQPSQLPLHLQSLHLPDLLTHTHTLSLSCRPRKQSSKVLCAQHRSQGSGGGGGIPPLFLRF
jgi:hypothetical protein